MPVPAQFHFARCLLAWGCLWHACTGVAQTAPVSYSLPDCIDYANQNSFTLRLARLDEQIASAYVRKCAVRACLSCRCRGCLRTTSGCRFR
jgi:hypothetical protein